MRPDAEDIAALVALALIGWGFYQIWEPLAPLTTGSIIMAMVLLKAVRDGNHN